MPELHVGVSQAELAYAEATLSAVVNGAKIATRSAINDTARHGRSNLTKLMGGYLNLPAREIRDRINVKQLATSANLQALITIDYKFVPLFVFRAKYSRRAGVSVTQVKGGAAQVFKHQFKQTMQSGHTGIFERRPGEAKIVPTRGTYAGRILKTGPNAGKLMKRQPIHETFGVSVLRAFELNAGLQEQALSDLADTLQARFASKIQWQLEKAKPDPPDSV